MQQEHADPNPQALERPVGRGLLNSTSGGGDLASLPRPSAALISTAEGDQEIVPLDVISTAASLVNVLSSGWSVSYASRSSSFESASLVSVLSAFGDPAELRPLSEPSFVLPGISVEQADTSSSWAWLPRFRGRDRQEPSLLQTQQPAPHLYGRSLPRLPRRRPQLRSADGSGWSSMRPRLAEVIPSRRSLRCADSSDPGPSVCSSSRGSGGPRGAGVR